MNTPKIISSHGTLLIVLSGISYGLLGYFGVTIVRDGFSVSSMLFWRFLIAGLLIFLFLLATKRPLTSSLKNVVTTFLTGSLLFSGGALFYFLACFYIGTGLSMVLFFTYPVLVYLLSWIFDNRKITKTTFIALGVICFGLYLLNTQENTTINITGCGLALFAAGCYGLYVYLSEKSVKRMNPTLSTMYLCFGSSLTFLIFSFFTDSFKLPNNMNVFLNILGISFVCTVLPVILLLEGLKTVEAGKASVISILEPVVTVIAGALFLNESFHMSQIIGSIIILTGAFAIQINTKNLIHFNTKIFRKFFSKK